MGDKRGQMNVTLTEEERDWLDVLLTQVPGVLDYVPRDVWRGLLEKIRAPLRREGGGER